MTVSSLITLFGILFAIIAIISEKNREYVFLKFSKLHIGILVFSFLFIHYLLSFNWLLINISFLKVFEIERFPTSDIWAYITSISILIWIAWRIFYGKFPLSRKDQLLKYYRKLILRGDFKFLAQLIEIHHLNQVVEYLKTQNNDDVEYGFDKIDIVSKKNKLHTYGESIYGHIILNDLFLEMTAKNNPYLFANIIAELKSSELKNDELVNNYLKILTLNKNYNFFREIRNTQRLGKYDSYVIEKEHLILKALINDINVCSINQAWRGISEQALLEMHEESKKGYSPLRESNHDPDNDMIWTYRIKNAIHYIDIMVRQAIVKNHNYHMWMFYYLHFTRVILQNMIDINQQYPEKNRYSLNFILLQDIFENLMSWKEVIIKSENKILLKSVIDCSGQCIFEIATTEKLRREDSHFLINWFWENQIKTCGINKEQRIIVDELLNYGLEMFKNPSFLATIDFKNDKDQKYLKMINYLWDEKDTPIFMGEVNNRGRKFKKEVVNYLNETAGY